MEKLSKKSLLDLAKRKSGIILPDPIVDCCLEIYDDVETAEEEWTFIETLYNGYEQCLKQGYTKEWSMAYALATSISIYQDQEPDLEDLRSIYQKSTKPEDDLERYCIKFNCGRIFKDSLKAFIKEDYSYRYYDWIQNSTDIISSAKAIEETHQTIIANGHTEDYADYYMSNAIREGDNEIHFCAEVYEKALSNNHSKEEAEKIAREASYDKMEDHKCDDIKLILNDQPSWAFIAIIKVWGSYFADDFNVRDESAFVQNFVDSVQNAKNDTEQLTLGMVAEDALEYYYQSHSSEMPLEWCDQYWRMNIEPDLKHKEKTLDQQILEDMFPDSENLQDDIEDFINSYE